MGFLIPGLKGYLPAEGYESQLESELGNVHFRWGRLLFAMPPVRGPYWTQNVWENPMLIAIESIGDAVKKLRALQRNWSPFPYLEQRRMALIQQELARLPNKPLSFPCALPKHPMGSWTLIDKNTLLISSQCASRFSNGLLEFEEPLVPPPGRAYLKLWEALTRLQIYPSAGQRCLELGASPGSWTWVISQLGASVTAVDRAPLETIIARMPGVSFVKGNAFSMTPDRVGDIDWLFSDVICYPEKLLEFVKEWLASGRCRRFLCTLKFQGHGGYDVANAFAAIPGSQVIHLCHNKHELTWMCLSS